MVTTALVLRGLTSGRCFRPCRNAIGSHCKVSGSSAALGRRYAHSSVENDSLAAYRRLGIPSSSSLAHVKQTFVRLAMEKHPDRPNGSAAEFMQLRTAFETIMTSQAPAPPTQDERNRHQRNNNSHCASDDDWQEWFRLKTGMDLAFEMSDSTREEVVQAYRTLSAGGKDDSGYWDLAKRLSEHDAATPKSKKGSILRLSSFSSTQHSPNGDTLRRKRKRGR